MTDPAFDEVDALLDQVLSAPDAEWTASLAAVCRDNPEHARALEQRFRGLEQHGVIEPRPRALPGHGSTFGDYRIAGVLGHGAMGVVFDAVHEPSGEAVALKVLRPELVDEPKASRRFEQEGELARQVDHPNLCRVVATGTVEGAPFLAMQRVVGETLADRVARARRHGRAPDTSGKLIALATKVARGLGSLHAAGLVHRDVKPANVLVTDAGEPLLCDFGLAWSSEAASLTGTGAVLGTPAYMAPEQVRSEGDVTPRTDVYGFGATLYELLTSRPPFEAAQREELYRRILTAEPEHVRRANPAVSTALATIVGCCLEKDPRRRYADGNALADDLERARTGAAIVARPPSAARRVLRSIRRHPAVASLLLAAVIALAGATVFAWQKQRETELNAMLVSSFAERLAGKNPIVAAAAARDAFRTVQDGATRSALVATLPGLHQADEVTGRRLCGWAAELPNRKLVRTLAGFGPRLARSRSIAGTWDEVVNHGGHYGAVSASGSHYATATGRFPTPRLFDASSVEIALPVMDPPIRLDTGPILRPLTVMDFDRDRLFVGDVHGRVTVFSLAGELVDRWQAHPRGRIRHLEVLPDGRVVTVAIAQEDGGRNEDYDNRLLGVRISSPADPEGSALYDEAGARVLRAAAAGDGSRLFVAIGTGHERRKRILVLPTGGSPPRFVELPSVQGRIPDFVTALAADADGGHVVVGTGGRKMTYLLQRDERAEGGYRVIPIGALATQAMSATFAPPDSETRAAFAVGAWGGRIHVFTADGHEMLTLQGHEQAVAQLQFVARGTELVSASWDGSVQRWRMALPDLPVAKAANPVSAAAWLPDGRGFVATTRDGMTLLDRDGREVATVPIGRGGGLVTFAVSPPGHPRAAGASVIASNRERGAASLWAYERGTATTLRELGLAGSRVTEPHACAFTADHHLVVGANQRLLLLDPDGATAAESAFGKSHDDPESLAVSPTGLIACAGDSDVRLWRRETDASGTDRLVMQGKPIPFAARANAVAVSPGEDSLLIGLGNGRVVLRDLATGRQRLIGRHDGQVRAVDFSAAGDLILSAGGDGSVRVWSIAGEPWVDLPHAGVVHAAAFSPDGNHVLTASSDQTARIWPIRDGELLRIVDDLLFREPTAAERNQAFGRR